MDNKDLSLEEILAGNNDDFKSDASGTEKALTLEEIIARDRGEVKSVDDNDFEGSELRDIDDVIESNDIVHNDLTADEIIAEMENSEKETETEKSDDSHSVLTIDEILGESSDTEDSDESIDDEAAEDDNKSLSDDDLSQEDISDDYEDDIDNAPTMVMPKNQRRRPQPRRRRPVKKKRVVKKSKFNGSIFGGIILVCIILTASIVLSITAISIATEYYGIGKSDKDVIFNIPEGSSNEKIADLLYENNIIRNKSLFLLALKIEKPEAIFPGDITLQASMGYSDVIEKLSTMREKLKTVNVTITEGMNLLDVANLLEKNKVCKAEDFLFEFNKEQDFDFEKDLGVSKDAFYRMEGYFYPDTYNFYVDDTAYNVTKIVRTQFQSVLNADIIRQVRESKFSLNQIMILASLVQLEAASEAEMPKVASVFVNRMNDQATFPNLQSNTTNRYIEKVIKKKAVDETSVDHYISVYDTYTCRGLPASPICNPGLAAIKAVLNPAKTDYYYFCNNLTTRETFYARTLEEHNANLKKAGLA